MRHRAKATQWDAMTFVLYATLVLAGAMIVMAVAW